jgi:hypothetical protein
MVHWWVLVSVCPNSGKKIPLSLDAHWHPKAHQCQSISGQ